MAEWTLSSGCLLNHTAAEEADFNRLLVFDVCGNMHVKKMKGRHHNGRLTCQDMSVRGLITVIDKGDKTHVYNLSPKLVETLRVWTRDREDIRKNTK